MHALLLAILYAVTATICIIGLAAHPDAPLARRLSWIGLSTSAGCFSLALAFTGHP